jgi:hypothetical protein
VPPSFLEIAMFALPTLWNLIISTLVFFIAVWYINRILDEQQLPGGMTRGVLVFVLASMLSWGAGELVDRIEGKTAQADVSQLKKALDQPQP